MAETPPTPTYHVSIWDEKGPSYVCLLCHEAWGLTVEGVTTHLRAVHDADAIPTPGMETLLAIRTEADALRPAAEPGAQTTEPHPEEPAHG